MKSGFIFEKVIDSVVKSVLKEITDNGNEIDKIKELYREIEKLLYFKCSDWHYCHLKYNWEKYINSLREIPIKLLSKYSTGIETRRFIRKCSKIEYPMSLKNKHITQKEMANALKNVLNYAYKIYGNYINNIE